MDKILIDIFKVKPEVLKLTKFRKTEFAEVHAGKSNNLLADLILGENNWTKTTEVYKKTKDNLKRYIHNIKKMLNESRQTHCPNCTINAFVKVLNYLKDEQKKLGGKNNGKTGNRKKTKQNAGT